MPRLYEFISETSSKISFFHCIQTGTSSPITNDVWCKGVIVSESVFATTIGSATIANQIHRCCNSNGYIRFNLGQICFLNSTNESKCKMKPICFDDGRNVCKISNTQTQHTNIIHTNTHTHTLHFWKRKKDKYTLKYKLHITQIKLLNCFKDDYRGFKGNQYN